MKLKLVVALMCVMGLISCPSWATSHPTSEMHSLKDAKHDDFKGVVEVCPLNTLQDIMLDAMGQNLGRAKPTVDCLKLISFAGGINFDAGFGQIHSGYTTENMRRFALNDAYLNVFGNVNEWTSAFLSVSYDGFNQASLANNRLNGTYSNAYARDQLQLEQGTITFKNLTVAPIFVRVGKEFEDFGRYQIHPITRTLAQSLSESLHTTAQIGFLTPNGLYGSMYTFGNQMKDVTDGHDKNNYGVALGYMVVNEQLGYSLGVGYLNDFTGVQDIAYGVGTFNGTGMFGTYTDKVGAVAAYGDLSSGPFSIGLRYVTATQTFSPLDLGTRAVGQVQTSGAKPWAADLLLGYAFNALSKDQNLYIGYQASQDAVNLFLPRSRIVAGYGISVWKRTDLGLQWDHDYAYAQNRGGLGESSNLVKVRAAVQFG